MKHVAIIGGGAAAAVVVGEILRHQRSTTVAITWLTGPGQPGRGIAYSTRADHHVLNVRAAGMGLFADDLGAFFRHACTRSPNIKASDFLPRAWFGDFVEATLMPLIDVSRERGQRIDMRDSVAVGIRGDDDSGYLIDTDNGKSVNVDSVVLAIGALPSSALAEVTESALDSGNYCVDAWQTSLRASAPARIVVIGTGLTAVDVILQASTQWPEAHITAISRHGRLPAAHLREPGQPYEHQTELIEEMLARPSVRCWSHALREAVSDHATDWRAVIDGLRPATTRLWQSLSGVERSRFVRHLRSLWEPMRHRLPPQTAAAIDQLREAGRLQIIRAHIDKVDGTAPLHIHVRERGTGTQCALDADLVVQATGPRLDASATRDPLIAQLLADGRVQADAVGLGLSADNDGHLHDATGKTARDMRVIGALLRGSLWECAAFAEIRSLARCMAHELVADSTPRKSQPTPISGLSRSTFALSG